MVKISVIMPVYNASTYLDMSISSLLEQKIDDVELICIDDGSTDNSLKIIEKYAKENDFINIIQQENSGSAKARNNGIQQATGEYIAFLDADDKFLDKDALNKMYNLAQKTDANMVGANLKRIKRDGSIEENYDYKKTLFTYFTKESIITPREYGIPWAFYKNIYKRTFLLENNIEFPNLKRGQDPVFLAKVLTKIDTIPTISIDLYGYNHTAAGGVNVKLNSYTKKRDYAQHFIDTFSILQENNFDEALSSYKKEFIDYLNFRDNLFDEHLQIVLQEKTALNHYFKENDYGHLIIDTIKNPPEEDENQYLLIKECLFEESMTEDSFIDYERLKEFTKITKTTSTESLELSFKKLKEIQNYTFEEKRKILGNVGKLQREIKYYIKNNHEILSSNSWKLTSFLRSFKHKL